MNCDHCQRGQCPITCPGLDKKTYPNKEIFNDAVQKLNELRDRMQETLYYFKSKAESKPEPIGCLNDKCNDWSPAEPDWSNCENLHPEEIKKCAFYLNDPNFEWVKVDKRNKNTYQTGFHDGYSKGKEAGLQQNKSGCACRFDNDGETILELCKAHSGYFEDKIKEENLTQDFLEIDLGKEDDWKSQIPWDKLEYDCVARDKNGIWYQYYNKPILNECTWIVGQWTNILNAPNMPQGPEDWKDSLAVRPGKEEE